VHLDAFDARQAVICPSAEQCYDGRVVEDAGPYCPPDLTPIPPDLTPGPVDLGPGPVDLGPGPLDFAPGPVDLGAQD
jgi:hypothetical protein